MTVKVNVGDIVFKDACKCPSFCCYSDTERKEEVYVNTSGRVEPFCLEKAENTSRDEMTSRTRSLRNMQISLQRKAEKARVDYASLRARIDPIFLSGEKEGLKRRHIDTVNEIMIKYLREVGSLEE